MSDLRAPGHPGGTRGKSCPQQNQAPLTDDANDEGQETAMGMGSTTQFGTTPGKTSGRKGNPVR